MTGISAAPTPAAVDLASLGRDLPALVLHEPVLAHNLVVMRDYCAGAGVQHAPHAKTHMAPELVERQAGSWAFTAALPAQVRQLAAWSTARGGALDVPRILHANLAVDPEFLAWVASELLGDADSDDTVPLDYLVYVDSVASVALLGDALRSAGAARPLRVLLEIGFPGGRTGARDAATASAIIAAVLAEPALALAGVAAFEGLMPLEQMPDLFARVRDAVTAVRPHIAGAPIVTAGGSSYFDRVVAELGPATWEAPTEVVLRSGCYLTHDHGVYRRTSPLGEERGALLAGPGGASGPRFAPAFELLARVLSVPEPGLAIVGFGRREAPTDDRMPEPLDAHLSDAATTASVTAVNDHHAFLRTAVDREPRVGDVLRFGISHPCGAFDRWRRIPLIDDAGRAIGDIHPHLGD